MVSVRLWHVMFLFVLAGASPQTTVALPQFPVSVDAQQQAAMGQVVVQTDLASFFPLSQHATVEAVLCRAGTTDIVRRNTVWPGLKATRIGVDMIGLSAGDYDVSVVLRNKNSERVAASAARRFAWAEPAADTLAAQSNLKMRNSLVIELLHLDAVALNTRQERTFFQPYDGWVFIRSAVQAESGSLDVRRGTVDGDVSLVRHPADRGRSSLESMRYLPKGKHTIRLVPDRQVTLESLDVLAIPELMYISYPDNPHLPESGVYDWAFLDQHVLKNLNTIIVEPTSENSAMVPGDFSDRYRARMREWNDQGKHWLFHGGVPGLKLNTTAEIDQSEQYWRSHPGMRNPLASGIIVDEFTGASNDKKFPQWAEAVDRVYKDPVFKGKRFYAYKFGQPWVEQPESKTFFDAVVRHNGVIVEEWYPPSRSEENGIDADMVWYRNYVDTWQRALPGVNRHLAIALGYMSCPVERLNVTPSVDFKVHMDMYMNAMANDPTFFGLYGLQWYKSSYAEEEYVRWGSRLFRHYAIEGKRNLLSNELGFEYHLHHIDNPDFENGTKGWIITSAEKDGIDTKRFNGFGYLSGNYQPAGPGPGDTVLWMRRSAKQPNTASQTIRNLKPGRLYSAKMISADYLNLTAGKSERTEPGVTLAVNDKVQIVEDRCFCRPIHGHPERKFGAFNGQNPAWLHYHQVVFRAQNETAQLQICEASGSPTGRECMCNFIQVQPYYAE